LLTPIRMLQMAITSNHKKAYIWQYESTHHILTWVGDLRSWMTQHEKHKLEKFSDPFR
jgi:hypothetical protein